MSDESVLTIREVADLLRIGDKKAYELAREGELPAFRVGGQWRFQRSAIEEWMKAQTQVAVAVGAKVGRK